VGPVVGGPGCGGAFRRHALPRALTHLHAVPVQVVVPAGQQRQRLGSVQKRDNGRIRFSEMPVQIVVTVWVQLQMRELGRLP
jgi:hypothetical protein